MAYTYSRQAKENQAKALGLNLPISTKHCMEVCRHLRGKKVVLAKKTLTNVIAVKQAIPYTKYHFDLGHKAGMGPGRYPISTCKSMLKVLINAEANAQSKGLRNADLVIKHISAQIGPTVWKYGRQGRQQAKRTHVEIFLEEQKDKKSVKS
ncbi:MAG: 50S ribosomal protein L22 [Candidatus Woesearchaeota archaeon]|nr:50S ribosomal protein L22 [Candidatus Woesearchaeota archaeon]